MKTAVFTFAFVAAVAAYAYPPVTESDGNDSPAVIYRTDVEMRGIDMGWRPPVVSTDSDMEYDDVSGPWPVPRPVVGSEDYRG